MAKSLLRTPWVVGRGLWRSLGWPPARSSPIKAGCSGLCLAWFWVSCQGGDATLTLGPAQCLAMLMANICFSRFPCVPAAVRYPSFYPCTFLRRAWPSLHNTSDSVVADSSNISPNSSLSGTKLTCLCLSLNIPCCSTDCLCGLCWPSSCMSLVLGSPSWTQLSNSLRGVLIRGTPSWLHSCWHSSAGRPHCKGGLLAPGQFVVLPSAFLQRCYANSMYHHRELPRSRCEALL